MTVVGAVCGCGFDAEVLCGGEGAVFAIALEGPLAYQYAVCRLVPQGLGTPAATTDEFRCTDGNNDNVVDLIDGALLTTQFGAGFCGYPLLLDEAVALKAYGRSARCVQLRLIVRKP
jgi:hypothetical protein